MFDKLTMMIDYQLCACPKPAEGPTKIALDLELELFNPAQLFETFPIFFVAPDI